jgi:hypothetical protein
MRCGYDLSGHNRSGRCPECGTSVATTADRPTSYYRARRLQLAARCVAWGIAAVSAALFWQTSVPTRLQKEWEQWRKDRAGERWDIKRRNLQEGR